MTTSLSVATASLPPATASLPPATAAGPTGGWDADVFARACPSRRVLEHIASKWATLALGALRDGAYRFNALRRRVDGISEKMLAQTLHALERDGLVRREVQATIPARVEYSLTPLGARIAERLVGLIEVVEAELPEILAAQAAYDAAQVGRE